MNESRENKERRVRTLCSVCFLHLEQKVFFVLCMVTMV